MTRCSTRRTVAVRVRRSRTPAIAVGTPPSSVEALEIDLSWQRDAVVLCEVLDGHGRPLESDSSGGTLRRENRSAHCNFAFSPIPPDAQLRLTIQRDGRTVRVPFVLGDIEVPPFPAWAFEQLPSKRKVAEKKAVGHSADRR